VADRTELDAYRLALGRMVDLYGHVEVYVHSCFSRIVNIPHDVADVIKAKNKAVELVKLMRSVVPMTLPSEAEEALSVFGQFLLIAEARNKILHRSADLTPSGTYVAWSSFADGPHFEFTREGLDHMSFDLYRIQFRLLRLAERSDRDKYLAVEPALFDAWRYKSL